ncbi:hypothetical protein CLU81_0528 [Flavobacterium sp. 9]|nr:hypothetical protein CLU81_0528 [Flavobacterium sp. 9]
MEERGIQFKRNRVGQVSNNRSMEVSGMGTNLQKTILENALQAQ